MNRSFLKAVIFLLSLSILISSCSPGEIPFSSSTATSTNTNTPSPTLKPTFTPTPTPMPVNLQTALDRGTLSEIEYFGTGKVQDSIFSPDGNLFVAVLMRGIHVYDSSSWNEITILPLTPEMSITSVVFSVDGTLFAAGDAAGNVTFWDTEKWEVKQVYPVHDGKVTSLDIAPDNQRFVTIGERSVIRIWNMSDGTMINSQVRSKNTGPANYSIDGSRIFISEATMYSDLTIWTAEDLQLVDRINQLGRTSPNHAVSPFSNVIASYGFGDLYLYDFETKVTDRLEDLFGLMEDLTHLMFLDEHNLILKGEYSDFFYLVNIPTKAVSKISFETLAKKTMRNSEVMLVTKEREIQSLGFTEFSNIEGITADGKSLILSDGILNLAENEMINQPKQCEFDWEHAVVLSEGDIASVSTKSLSSDQKNKGIFLINKIGQDDLTRCSTVSFGYELESEVEMAALSSDGSFLAAGTIFGKLSIWDLKTKEKIGEVQAHNMQSVFGHKGAFSSIVFESNNLLVATLGWDGTVKVWDLNDLSQVDMVYGANPTFAPDGKYLAYIIRPDRIVLKSLNEDIYPLTLVGENSSVQPIQFIPDSDLLISGGRPGLEIWSISQNQVVAVLPQYSGVSALAVDPDGTRLFIRTYDGVISVWGNVPQ